MIVSRENSDDILNHLTENIHLTAPLRASVRAEERTCRQSVSKGRSPLGRRSFTRTAAGNGSDELTSTSSEDRDSPLKRKRTQDEGILLQAVTQTPQQKDARSNRGETFHSSDGPDPSLEDGRRRRNRLSKSKPNHKDMA